MKGSFSMSIEELKAMLQRFTEEAWNQGKTDFMDELCAIDIVSHDSGRPDLKGSEAYKHYILDCRIDMPDFHVTIDEILGEGNTVVTHWTFKATFTGPGKIFPVPATGKKAITNGAWIGHFENDKLVEDWYIYDVYSQLQQLGILPAAEQSAS